MTSADLSRFGAANALGGAVSITLKNGFSYTGAQAEGRGGSFGRCQYGAANGDTALYVAGQGLTEEGLLPAAPRAFFGGLRVRL